MVAVKTSKDPNQNGRKEALNHLNENLEKLIKVLENKLPATTSSNGNLSKTEEARRKKEEEQRRKEEKKQREEDLKAIKEALKDTIPADTRRDIGSTAIGSFTGINPVLVKTFGLDKLVQSIGVAAIHKVRSRTKSKREEQLEAEAGGTESNVSPNEEQQEETSSSLFGTTKKQKKTNKLNQAANGNIITDKTDSAVEQNKQNQNPFKKGLDTIVNLMKGNKKGDTKEKEKEQESWLKKLLKAGIFGLLMAGMLKAFGGAGSIIKDFMDSFFANTLGLGVGGVVISDMLPGALLGAKLGGLHGALVGGTISLAYFSIKRVVNDYERRSKQAEKGVYSEAASICGIPANIYMGMIAGGIAGFTIYGPIGAVAGAIIGAGAGWIYDLLMDAEIRAKVAKAKQDEYDKKNPPKTKAESAARRFASGKIFDEEQAEIDAEYNTYINQLGGQEYIESLREKVKGNKKLTREEQITWNSYLQANLWKQNQDVKVKHARDVGKDYADLRAKFFSNDKYKRNFNRFDKANASGKSDGYITWDEYEEAGSNWAGQDTGRIQKAIRHALDKHGGKANREQIEEELLRVMMTHAKSGSSKKHAQASRSYAWTNAELNNLDQHIVSKEESLSNLNNTVNNLESFDPTTEAREQKMKNDSLAAQETAANKLNELVNETKKTNEILNKQNGMSNAETGLLNWGFFGSGNSSLNLNNSNKKTSKSIWD